jgi:CBS-domain-containing membrane protein
MVDKVITIAKDATLEEAVKLMNEYEIGCLIVMENKKPVGIMTERDLLKRVLSKSKQLGKKKVTEVMSENLVSVSPQIEIEEAARLMYEKKIKKLPVIEKGKLLGLVTLTDILRIHPQIIRMYKIFSSDLAPRRMKKVLDYYLLLQNEPKDLDLDHTVLLRTGENKTTLSE